MAANLEAVARTRSKIHDAAIRLFTKRGYHGTGIREIAREAGVSLGNLYNHHKNKEELFAAIMAELEEEYTAPGTPLDQAFESFNGVADLEALGHASGEMVERFSDYIKLIYVDVVELGGEHLKKLYGGMRQRYERRFDGRLHELAKDGKFHKDDPISAMMIATITYFFYFNIRKVFGVDNFFAPSDEQAVAMMANILKIGLEPKS